MLALKVFLCFNILLLCHGQNTPINPSTNYLKDPIDEYIERPCENYDKFCIRKFLVRHSHCRPVDGPVPDPLYRDQTNGYVANANITIHPNIISINGLNGRVEEFYINRKTDNLVLSVEFNALYAASNYGYVSFHRRAKEPLVYLDFVSLNYTSVIITITIPHLKDLQIGRAQVFGYSPEIPAFVLSPKILLEGLDPESLAQLAVVMANLPITVREIMLADSPYYLLSYIQYSLCDFGLHLV